MNYEYEIRDVWFRRDELKIYGMFYLPRKEGKLATFVLCHGFGVDHHELERDARSLAEMGYAALLFDFCGGGGMKSEGKMTEMSIFTEKKDLEAVLAGVQGMACVDPTRIYLMGASQGGAVCAMAAADHVDEVRGLVLLYPAFNIPDYVKSRLEKYGDTPRAYRVIGWDVGKTYARGVADYDIYADVARYTGPVLILQGDADELVDVSYARRARDAYANARLEILPGAGHGFYDEYDVAAIEKVADFTERTYGVVF